MSKKFGLFGDSDLFFARKLKPLADETKMRKFNGSRIIAGCVAALALYIPYLYFNVYLEYTTKIMGIKL